MMQIDLFPDLVGAQPTKPHQKPKPESIDDIADRMTGELLSRCEQSGVNPKAVALELKLREVERFLAAHYSPDEATGFAMRLLKRTINSAP
jgi:hypothetical protein